MEKNLKGSLILSGILFIGLCILGLSQSVLADGGISSGTPPEFLEASCVSAGKKVAVQIVDKIPDPLYEARLNSPAGEESFLKVKRTPEGNLGTPDETPRIYSATDFKLKISITDQPIPVEGTY